jgi:DNA ligase D-like protein (predicted polymerase)
MAKSDYTTLEAAGIEVKVSSPGKLYFPDAGVTKLDLAEFYLEFADHVLLGLRERPTVLKRWVEGISGEPFFQKRLPPKRPDWIESATISFPSGRTAEELVPVDAAHLVWAANLGNIDFNPHPIRRSDLDHPDELRIDLDPQPDIPWSQVKEVAMCANEVLAEHGLVGYPKTSGSRGIHVYVRIEQRWTFGEVRRAALAFAREVERRLPGKATSKWWKEEREGVFLDYNQNAKDHTIASVYSVRPLPDARTSCALTWDELPDVEAADLTIRTVAERLRSDTDPYATIDDQSFTLDSLLDLAQRDEDGGLGDAPWPPHFAKQPGEPKRVQPSRARKDE